MKISPLHENKDANFRTAKWLLFFTEFTLLFEERLAASQMQGTDDRNTTECLVAEHDGITLVSFRWQEIGVYFTIVAFVIIAGFAKLGFHKLSWLSSKVPESCLLVLLGLIVGLIIYFTTDDEPRNPSDVCYPVFKFPQFSSETFFLILLPPIILESAYSLHDRVFLDNLGTVLVFAVIGTLFNAFAIGATLYGINKAGLIPHMDFNLTDALVFSTLISAVDPVAVLAIFQELGVNQNLYFLVFGESLLNDGVTVVLYNTMQSFRRMSVISVGDYLLAVVVFFIVTFGGILIGIFYGVLTSFVTKCTYSVRVVEPLALLGLAYLSYISAELFHFSGIISLIVCGLIQAHYGFLNISQKSYICVKYFTKMASATSDTIIFMFLGMVLVNDDHEWNTAFVLWSLLLCFVYRFIAVFLLSALTNIYRSKRIDFEEQFIAAYGGLRGAVAFSLASTLDQDMGERNTYIFTTLVVILYTIFVQGITIKPLVHLLKIKRRSYSKQNLVEEISATSMDHMMAGIEEILGHHGDFYLREMIMHYNDKYLKRWLLHGECDSKLTRLFEKIVLSEHYAHLYGPVAMVEDHMKPLIDYPSKEDIGVAPYPPLLPEEEIIFRGAEPHLGTDFNRDLRNLSITDLEDPLRQRLSVDLGTKEQKIYGVSAEDHPPPRRMSTMRSFFPGTPTPTSPPPEVSDGNLLRKAFRDNRYNKLHYTYNRNLVNEEDQELSTHLNRRSFNARRMSTLASAKSQASEDVDIPGQVPQSRGKSVMFESLAKSLILLERHKRRSVMAKDRVRSAQDEHPILEDQGETCSLASITSQDLRRNAGVRQQALGIEEGSPLLEIVTEKRGPLGLHDASEPTVKDDQC